MVGLDALGTYWLGAPVMTAISMRILISMHVTDFFCARSQLRSPDLLCLEDLDFFKEQLDSWIDCICESVASSGDARIMT